MIKSVLIISIIFAISRAAVLSRPRSLMQPSHSADQPSPDNSLTVTYYLSFLRINPFRRGLVIRRQAPTNNLKTLEAQIYAVAKENLLKVDKKFVELVAAVFSKPFVTEAWFLEVNTPSGASLRRLDDHPAILKTQLVDQNSRKFEVNLLIDWENKACPRSYLQFDTRGKKTDGTLCSLGLSVPVADLQAILEHVAGVKFPQWQVKRISQHLENNAEEWTFDLNLPSLPDWQQSSDPGFFEYLSPEGNLVTEKLDQSGEYLIQHHVSKTSDNFILLLRQNKVYLKTWLGKNEQESRGFRRLSVKVYRLPASPVSSELLGSLFSDLGVTGNLQSHAEEISVLIQKMARPDTVSVEVPQEEVKN